MAPQRRRSVVHLNAHQWPAPVTIQRTEVSSPHRIDRSRGVWAAGRQDLTSVVHRVRQEPTANFMAAANRTGNSSSVLQGVLRRLIVSLPDRADMQLASCQSEREPAPDALHAPLGKGIDLGKRRYWDGVAYIKLVITSHLTTLPHHTIPSNRAKSSSSVVPGRETVGTEHARGISAVGPRLRDQSAVHLRCHIRRSGQADFYRGIGAHYRKGDLAGRRGSREISENSPSVHR